MVEACHGLQAWVERLNEAELPALAVVVKELLHLTQHHQASVQQLADVLLRDASLTSKVLRIANSVYYNPTQESIRTISRAIVLIGFDNVREIGLSVCLIDSLLGNAPRDQLQELLARSFHGAVQARNMAGYVLNRHQEEMFIAGLLYHLGELAFWGSGGEQVDQLATLLEQADVDVGATVREVLGVSFPQLTQGLVKNWNLGEIFVEVHSHASRHDPVVRAVNLGARISEAALEGWDTPEMEKLVAELAGFIGVSEQEAMAQVLASAEEAVKVVTTFGAPQLSKLIPNTDPEQIRQQQAQRKARLLQPDLRVLQQAMQELGQMAAQRGDLNRILDTLFRGLHSGAGLERVMLAVLADQQSCFRAKRVVGEDTQHWMKDFVLPANQREQAHIFSYVLRHKEAIWMGVPASYNLNELVTSQISHAMGHGMFFIAPLLAGSKEIGVLYADNRVSGRALSREQYVAFQRFTQLTGRCLEQLSKKA